MPQTRWLTFVFLCLFLVTSADTCWADDMSNEKDWVVPVLGVFKVPKGFMAAEFSDLTKRLDSQKDKFQAKAPVLPIPQKQGKPVSAKPDVAAYQLTMDDGQAYHLAWLVAVRDTVPLDPAAAEYFNKPLNIQQKVSAVLAHDSIIQTLDKMQYTDPATGAGVKLLELDPLAFQTLNGLQTYGCGARFLITYQNFIFPFYAKGYIFSVNNQSAAIFLITTDSERAFWSPVLQEVFPTLRPGKK